MAKQKRDGFFKRGKMWWTRDPVTDKPSTTHCTSIEAARRWKAERELMSVDPAYARSKVETLGTWAEKLKDLNSGKSEATRQFDESKIKALLGTIDADTPLSQIKAGTFDRYVVQRRKQHNKHKGKAPGDYTIRRELNMLVRILKMAKRDGAWRGELDTLIPLTLKGSYTPRQRALTEVEVGKFISALPNARWRTLALVAVAVGCRLSEACKLTRGDIDTQLRLVYLRGTKTKKSERELPILKSFSALLDRAMPYLPVGKISNVDRTFKLAAKRAGIDRCSPNDLRRTHSTLLGERGLDENLNARLLGHETITLTKRAYNRARAVKLQHLVEAYLETVDPIDIRIDSLQLDDSRTKKSGKTR